MNIAANLRFELALGLRRAPSFPKAAVALADVQRGLHVFLHALAGSCRLEIVPGSEDVRDGLLRRKVSVKRHWHELAWQNPDHAHLPQQIARFPDRALNRDLYYWLAAYLAFESEFCAPTRFPPGLEHLLRGVAVSELLVGRYPGLRRRYTRLCRACLEERDTHCDAYARHQGAGFTLLEAGIRNGLGDPTPVAHPWLTHALNIARRGEWAHDPPAVLARRLLPFWPAAVWGHPSPPAGPDTQPLPALVDPELLEETPSAGYHTDEPTEEQSYDPDARDRVADGDRLTGALLYPEWHYRRHEYRPDWCRVYEQVPPAVTSKTPDRELQQLAARIRRRFEAFRLQDHWRRRMTDGEEVDVDAFVDAASERRATGHRSERLYRHRIRNERELSVAVLLDVSNSTQGRIDGLHRVIDIAQRAMLVVAEALQGLRDEFALYAFSSYSRAFVDCLLIKSFTETYSDTVRQRILGLGPEGSTRMGAALRHVGGVLAGRSSRHRLLLVLTDGRPYDPADRYEGRYALEDTRRALIDLRALGVFPFGLTIDQKGQEYLPHLFGVGRYMVISNVADCWHHPYMSREELNQEIEDGVVFWGHEADRVLTGVMGIQDKGDVHLIRHAYVVTRARRQGIGTRLLRHLESLSDKPLLVGTWADAGWAITFYEKNAYRLVTTAEKDRLLGKYWRIPKRQIETSVVLADRRWRHQRCGN